MLDPCPGGTSPRPDSVGGLAVVRFFAVLGQIKAFIFLISGDAQTDGVLDSQQDHQRGDRAKEHGDDDRQKLIHYGACHTGDGFNQPKPLIRPSATFSRTGRRTGRKSVIRKTFSTPGQARQ